MQGLLARALAELTLGGSSSTPAGVDAQAVQGAAAGTLTLVNSLLEQVGCSCILYLTLFKLLISLLACRQLVRPWWCCLVCVGHSSGPTTKRCCPPPSRYPRSQAVATAESTQMKEGADKMVEVLARLAKVCQVSTAGTAGPTCTVWHSMPGVCHVAGQGLSTAGTQHPALAHTRCDPFLLPCPFLAAG